MRWALECGGWEEQHVGHVCVVPPFFVIGKVAGKGCAGGCVGVCEWGADVGKGRLLLLLLLL